MRGQKVRKKKKKMEEAGSKSCRGRIQEIEIHEMNNFSSKNQDG